MKFRTLTVGLFTAALLPSLSLAQEVTLKVAHFLPPMAAAHQEFIVPWCDKLASESDNRIQCQHYPAMQLGGTPPQLFNQVRDGVADVIWTLPGYMPGRFPVSEIFELPFITEEAQASSRAFWDFVQANAMRELAGVKPIALWVNGPNVLHFRDKKVETLEDLQGMKIRAPSRLSNPLLDALGAVPVGMPVPQLAESLSRGVIEGALIPWEVVPATKTQELVDYHAELEGDGGSLGQACCPPAGARRPDHPVGLCDHGRSGGTDFLYRGHHVGGQHPGPHPVADAGAGRLRAGADALGHGDCHVPALLPVAGGA